MRSCSPRPMDGWKILIGNLAKIPERANFFIACHARTNLYHQGTVSSLSLTNITSTVTVLHTLNHSFLLQQVLTPSKAKLTPRRPSRSSSCSTWNHSNKTTNKTHSLPPPSAPANILLAILSVYSNNCSLGKGTQTSYIP